MVLGGGTVLNCSKRACLGFHEVGGFSQLATSAYTNEGPNHVFLFFPYGKTEFLAKRTMAQ